MRVLLSAAGLTLKDFITSGVIMQMDKKILKIIEILKKEYPDSRVALSYANPFELLAATILSAQCTDKKVNEITKDLFKRLRSVEDFAGIPPPELEKMVRPAGFYRTKAKNIINSAVIIRDSYGGRVPDTMEDLIKLPGVARKTANIVLSSVYKKTEGIAVDTHMKRLSGRIGLSENTDPNKIERDLMRIVPKQEWLKFNYYMVSHGRKVCAARKPLCSSCKISRYCEYYRANLSAV